MFKLSDTTVSNEGLGKSQKWNKSSKRFNFETHYDESEKVKSEWKNDGFSNAMKNSSTLSLHIQAYENSFVTDQFGSTNNKHLIEKWENAKFDAPTFLIQNPFEFPRQQNEKVLKPEMLQYKASQRLFNPNKVSKNVQKVDETVTANIVQERFASSSHNSFSNLRNQIWPLFGAIFVSSVLLQKKSLSMIRSPFKNAFYIASRRNFVPNVEKEMSHLYKQYMRVIAKWPRDKFKSDQRNLGFFFERELEKVFKYNPSPPETSICERRLKALTELVENRHMHDFPHKYTSGMFGMKQQQLHAINSDEFRQQLGLGEPKKSLFARLFSRK